MGQEPGGACSSTLAPCRGWSSVVKVAINVDDMDFLKGTAQCVHSSHNHAAVTSNQERDLLRPAQRLRNLFADDIPNDPWTGPTPDGRNRMMWKIARDRDVPCINHFAADRAEAADQTGLSVGLSIVLAPGIERARPKWNSQNHVDRSGFTHARTCHRSRG